MELRQIRFVVAVAETLSFRRAGEQLDVGQPAVSQQVARLERELGVRLFDRTSRTVEITEAGQRFLPEARAVLAAVDRARASATGGGRRTSRVIRLGSSTGLGDRLDRLLEALRRTDPRVELELSSADTRTRLARVRSGLGGPAAPDGHPSAEPSHGGSRDGCVRRRDVLFARP